MDVQQTRKVGGVIVGMQGVKKNAHALSRQKFRSPSRMQSRIRCEWQVSLY